MISLGLIGYPLSHSLSPRLHAAAFQALSMEGEYRLYPIPPTDKDALSQLVGRLRAGELDGLNVTIPHKQAILPLLDELSASARAIGAVNTLVMKDGKLIGDNTDAPGFLADLQRSFPAGFQSRHALILGAGGAARAVTAGLLSEGWGLTLAVRRDDLAQAARLKSEMESAWRGQIQSVVRLEQEGLEPCLDSLGLIVNTTPLGMFPEVIETPWPSGVRFPTGTAVYDVVYNPRETAFLQQARQAGLTVASGIGMLVEQAALSFEIWTGSRPPREVLFSAVEVL
jgi:shikimate dehydrogenase